MGIGNTTTSSAAVRVLLDRKAEDVTGRGAGLTSGAFERKIEVIKKSIELHKPDKNDIFDVISKVGGYDIAALTGARLSVVLCTALQWLLTDLFRRWRHFVRKSYVRNAVIL